LKFKLFDRVQYLDTVFILYGGEFINHARDRGYGYSA